MVKGGVGTVGANIIASFTLHSLVSYSRGAAPLKPPSRPCGLETPAQRCCAPLDSALLPLRESLPHRVVRHVLLVTTCSAH